jgi:hypothetical protein
MTVKEFAGSQDFKKMCAELAPFNGAAPPNP